MDPLPGSILSSPAPTAKLPVRRWIHGFAAASALLLIALHPAAAQSVAEEEKAHAVAKAAFEQLMAAHSRPTLSDGLPLEPYTVDSSTALPTQRTSQTFLAAAPEDGLFWMRNPALLPTNRLAKTSSGTTPAHTADVWAYAGRTQDAAFHPAEVPAWIDYTDPATGQVTGRYAFAIWDESGKVDVNLFLPDATIDGLAPANLRLEQFSTDPAQLAGFLNGPNGARDRNHFSPRRITLGLQNDTGDDRRFFSTADLIGSGIIEPVRLWDVGVTSRDLEVRPEWNGTQTGTAATSALRSYINNPQLFVLLSDAKTSARLVKATLNETLLQQTLRQEGMPVTADSMQLMRLLATLRLSLPPFSNQGEPPLTYPLPANSWTDNDILGIAVNMVQATQAVADQNILTSDQATHGFAYFLDPNTRLGVRVSPYVTEMAVRVKRISSNQIEVEEFFEIWNPYSVDLRGVRYNYGGWSGARYEGAGFSPEARTLWGYLGRASTQGPDRYSFKVIKNTGADGGTSRVVAYNPSTHFVMRARPYLQHSSFWANLAIGTAVDESPKHAVSIAPIYSSGLSAQGETSNLVYFIPGFRFGPIGSEAWASFQIDDPRMGPATRYTSNYVSESSTSPMTYSWKFYANQHSLAGITAGPKVLSPFGDGYNQNFAPPSGSLDAALATFALPRRPLLSLGDLGSVFIHRPWKTLSFAAKMSPTDAGVPTGVTSSSYPTALLDLLTTAGTTTDRTDLPLKVAASQPPSIYNQTSLALRAQSSQTLFDSSASAALPQLRPIRGRINLNAASKATLSQLLRAPMRVVRSRGVEQRMSALGLLDGSVSAALDSDLIVRIAPEDADAMADELTLPPTDPNAIRPLRSMADLGKLKAIPPLHLKYPDAVVDAAVARLAQFGTLRQQIYTVDVISQSYLPGQPGVAGAEARMLATVHFDTFTRQYRIASIEKGLPLHLANDTTGITWTSGGARPWIGQTQLSSDGADSARSGSVNVDEESWMEANIQGPGTLSYFQLRKGIGSKLKVEIDGIARLDETGDAIWSQRSLGIPRGLHRVRWIHKMSVSPEEDEGAWVDRVAFAPSSAGYNAWADLHFTADELNNDPLTTPLEHFNTDNSVNHLDYAFDRSPRVASALPPVTESVLAEAGGRYLTIRFARRKNAPNLTYVTEASADLKVWTPGGTEVQVEPGPTGNTDYVTVRDTVPIAPEARRFLRVRVSQD